MATGELYEAVVENVSPPSDPRIGQLMWWAARFAELGFTPSYGPGDHGNLSCRTSKGLVTTARATRKSALGLGDFSEVVGADWNAKPVRLRCHGELLPSTDALMHLEIYRLRPDVEAIFHGHDSLTYSKASALRLPVTAHSAAAPSLDVIEDVKKLALHADYLLLKDHGFLALGKTLDDAGELVREVARRARSL